MFIYTAKFSPRKAVLRTVLLIAAIGAVLCVNAFWGSAGKNEGIPAKDDAERAAYLRSLGWTVEEAPLEAIALRLPDPLEEPYLSYNTLQLEQSFDLTPYAGKNIERYVYAVTNHPSSASCQANLYVFDGRLIAGDILTVGKDGFITPLAFPTET